MFAETFDQDSNRGDGNDNALLFERRTAASTPGPVSVIGSLPGLESELEGEGEFYWSWFLQTIFLPAYHTGFKLLLSDLAVHVRPLDLVEQVASGKLAADQLSRDQLQAIDKNIKDLIKDVRVCTWIAR